MNSTSNSPAVGEVIQSTRFTMLDILVSGFVVLAVRFLGQEFLFEWLGKVMKSIPQPLWVYGVPALGVVMILAGTRRVSTTISEADRTIRQEFYWLFAVPAGSAAYNFGQVRLVDFYHPGDVDSDPGPRRFFYINNWYLLWCMLPGMGSLQQYHIRVVLQDRTRLTICSGHGHERMADMATRIARMTKARLG